MSVFFYNFFIFNTIKYIKVKFRTQKQMKEYEIKCYKRLLFEMKNLNKLYLIYT